EDVVAVVVAVAKGLHDHEDQRQDHGEPEAEVGALLRDELAQLPAVGRRGGGAFETRDGERLGACGADGAHALSTDPPTPAGSRTGAGGEAPLVSSVSLKKRSSSVASSGVSERMPT